MRKKAVEPWRAGSGPAGNGTATTPISRPIMSHTPQASRLAAAARGQRQQLSAGVTALRALLICGCAVLATVVVLAGEFQLGVLGNLKYSGSKLLRPDGYGLKGIRIITEGTGCCHAQ